MCAFPIFALIIESPDTLIISIFTLNKSRKNDVTIVRRKRRMFVIQSKEQIGQGLSLLDRLLLQLGKQRQRLDGRGFVDVEVDNPLDYFPV